MPALRVVTPRTKHAVSLAEAKQHCRIANNVEDELIEMYIAAAHDYYEERTGRTIHDTEYEYALEGWPRGQPAIDLPRATPLIEVVSVIYIDRNGLEVTWPASNYAADTRSTPGRLVFSETASFPEVGAFPLPIGVRYRAGIPTSSPQVEAPMLVKVPILQMVAELYENRESSVVQDRFYFNALLNPLWERLMSGREAHFVF